MDMRGLSIVAISPMSVAGSLSMLDRWKLFLKHVLRCGVILSTAWKPMPRRNSSSVIVFVWGSPDLGLSIGRTDGGECVGGDYCVSLMLSLGII